ncbi:unnamed protein product [Candidula unifasciata]|uniref:DUF3990 domain-containing protein n=1 Tax=Candidula unifasciata TaxID=100452 RepID=A0A8S3ZLB4_9EUPU|nr:unnamed protein product [Candidula unifasciata]
MSHIPSARSSSCDYFHHITNKWYRIRVERPPEAEPPGNAKTGQIYLYNRTSLLWDSTPIDSVHAKLLSVEAGERIYYHGSNDCNIKNIIENGIDLTRSTRPVDFSCGGGFYVTRFPTKAVEWSRRVTGWKGGMPAVIAFKISQTLYEEEPHLKLSGESTTNVKFWECIVSHFRHAERSRDVHNALKDVKFITGWVANNKYLGDEETPRRYPFTQLCVRDQDYARRFGSLANISFVLFLVGN